VLQDRIEVRSAGRPPNSVDADAMRAGVHVARNRDGYARVVNVISEALVLSWKQRVAVVRR
jgi:hypothetical protein